MGIEDCPKVSLLLSYAGLHTGQEDGQITSPCSLDLNSNLHGYPISDD
jgi:hypothetical protein